MFGEEYINQHIKAFLKQKALVMYITDGIKILTENTARIGGGSLMNIRFMDVFKPQIEQDPNTIINKISMKLEQMGGED